MKKIEVACIIDDDSIYVFGLKKMIEMHNLCKNILVFKNGEEALKYFKPIITLSDAMPDVILLDINMPVLDGWGFLEEFTKLKPKMSKKVTIYMVSSSIHDSDIERARSFSEVKDYIVKPVKMDDLRKLLQEENLPE